MTSQRQFTAANAATRWFAEAAFQKLWHVHHAERTSARSRHRGTGSQRDCSMTCKSFTVTHISFIRYLIVLHACKETAIVRKYCSFHKKSIMIFFFFSDNRSTICLHKTKERRAIMSMPLPMYSHQNLFANQTSIR